MPDDDPDALPWSGLVDAINGGIYDIGMTGFSLTASRSEKVTMVLIFD